MNVLSEHSRSVWNEIEPVDYPRLESDSTADAVVVGSGIAGISTAYELATRGLSVIVLDRGAVARGMTARTTAHLTSALDDFYHEFISIRGEEMGQLHYESQAAAIQHIEDVQAKERIDCDFVRRDAYLFLAGEAEPKVLQDERKALSAVGLKGSKVISRPTVKHKLSDGPCLLIPEQGRFHPVRYLDGLAKACVKLKARICANTIVTAIEETPHGVKVRTSNGHSIAAGAVVVATNAPINDRLAITAKEAPYRSYVFAAKVDRDAIEDVLYWDTEDPYHYVRLHPFPDGMRLIVGGEDHKSGTIDDADRRFGLLEAWARERFPEMKSITHRWSGQVMDTIDFAAFIGVSPGCSRVFVVTGDSGQGITHGVVASLMLPELISTGKHRWSEVYDPTRKPIGAVGQFVSETKDVLANFAEKLLPGEISDEHQLRPGQGGIIRKGLKLTAVSRDKRGILHRHSASCPHAGCNVHWNSFEQCWDCPCHGSQFAPDGSAINGPAILPLQIGE